MTELWYLHLQWGPRAMPVDAQAELLVDLFELLHAADERLSGWLQGDGILAGAHELPHTEQIYGARCLIDEVGDGDPPVTRLDLQTVPVPGVRAADSRLTAGLGSTDPFEPNHVSWWPVDCAERFISDPNRADALLRAMVTLLDPDWAVWTTDEILSWQPRRPDGPLLGWMTYIAHRKGRLPAGEFVHRGQLARLARDARDMRPDLIAVSSR